jgi:hypothetical protein
MTVQRRAMVIAGLGPALQATGLLWEALHIALSHWNVPLSARHLIYEPGVLLVIVGFFLSLVCLPVALEVARATEAEVRIPVYEPQPELQQKPAPRFRRSRASR